MGLIKNISTLTTSSEESIENVKKTTLYIHSNDITTQLLESRDVFDVELFEGNLSIILKDDKVQYKFIPSEEFNNIVINTIKNKKSELTVAVEEKLKTVLINTYKDIL